MSVGIAALLLFYRSLVQQFDSNQLPSAGALPADLPDPSLYILVHIGLRKCCFQEQAGAQHCGVLQLVLARTHSQKALQKRSQQSRSWAFHLG